MAKRKYKKGVVVSFKHDHERVGTITTDHIMGHSGYFVIRCHETEKEFIVHRNRMWIEEIDMTA